MGSIHYKLSSAALACTILLVACTTRNKSDRVLETVQAKSTAAAPQARAENANADRDPDPYTVVFARHVLFHEGSVDLKAEWLQGRMYPTHSGLTPSLDDPKSFEVEIEEGKTALSLPQLSHLLSTGVLRKSNLKNVHFSVHGPREIEIRGTVHKLIALPVQVLGEMGTTQDGRISIRIESIKVLKIPFKGMLHAFKLSAGDLLAAKDSDAVQAHGDSIYLRTDRLLPAPRKLGKVTDVHFNSDGDLEEDYGAHSAEEMPVLPRQLDLKKWPNFLLLNGGTVRFGKLTMQDADLLLVDTSPGTWFGFDIERYREQLVAGDMHMTPEGGLQVWIPDIGKVKPR